MLNHKQIAVATILIAYISAFMLSNQAFAQILHQGVNPSVTDSVTQTVTLLTNRALGEEAQVGKILAAHEAQLGKILGSHPGLGCSPWDPRDC